MSLEQMSLDDACSEFLWDLDGQAPRLKTKAVRYVTSHFWYDALHLLVPARACDVSGAAAAGNYMIMLASTSQSMIRLIRLCAAMESHYVSPKPPQTARSALSQAITAVLHRVAHNA